MAGAEEDLSKAIERGQDDAQVRAWRACARVRLGRLADAQEDAERAELFDPERPSTHVCRGYLHLARREYDRAISRYEAALKLESQPGRQFDLGLALLLRGRLTDAREAYVRGVAAASITNIEDAQRELDFWTTQQPERAESPEAKEAIADIRQKLQTVHERERPMAEAS